MIDASRGFIKDGNKNRLRERTSARLSMCSPVSLKSRAIPAWYPSARSRPNDYNLNIPRYIDSSDPEDCTTWTRICAAVSLSATWTICTPIGKSSLPYAIRCLLWQPVRYLMGRVGRAKLKRTIQDNVDFQTYAGRVRDVLSPGRLYTNPLCTR